jgi:hypothetical protein
MLHTNSVPDFACFCMSDLAQLCVLGYFPAQNRCRFYDAKSTLPHFAPWLFLTLLNFACASNISQDAFSQPCKVVLQSITNICKVDFLWQRSIVLHRNNRIIKNYRILMVVCYYLNDLVQYSPTWWFEKVNVWFRGFRKSQEHEGGFGAVRFLKTSTHVPRFLVLKLHGIINPDVHNTYHWKHARLASTRRNIHYFHSNS